MISNKHGEIWPEENTFCDDSDSNDLSMKEVGLEIWAYAKENPWKAAWEALCGTVILVTGYFTVCFVILVFGGPK